jgi:hypothetical protein
MKFRSKQGLAALATIMVVLFIAMGMVIAMGGFGTSTREHQAQDHQVRIAGQAAQAALQLAMFRLATRAKWTQADDLTRAEFDSQNRVYISLRVLDNRDGTSSIKSPDGNQVPPGQAYIRALAEVEPDKPRGVRSNYSSRGALCDSGLSTYSYGVVADRGIEVLDGSVIDSYNSDVAQYEKDPSKNASLTNGSVQLNTSSKAVHLRQSKIDGELRCLQSEQQNRANLEPGNRMRMVPTVQRVYNPKYRPPYSPDQASQSVNVAPGETRTIEPGSYRSIQVASGGTLTLDNSKAPLCQFYVKEGVKIDGNLNLARTNNTDRVQLYIGKGLACNGASINFKGKPAHLSIFMVGSGNQRSGDNFSLKSGTQAWMLVNNPTNRAFILDNSHLFGALKAEFVWIQTFSAVHYDVALRKSDSLAGLLQWEMSDVAENASPSIVTEIRDANPPPGKNIGNYANFPTAPIVSVPGTVNEPPPPNSVPLVATTEQAPVPNSPLPPFLIPPPPPPPPATTTAGTSGAGTSGAGTSGAGTSGAGTSGAGTSGAGTSGAGTSGAGTSGAGTSGAGTSGGPVATPSPPSPFPSTPYSAIKAKFPNMIQFFWDSNSIPSVFVVILDAGAGTTSEARFSLSEVESWNL